MLSKVINKNQLLEVKSKKQLIRLAQKYLPNRRFRVLCDSKDVRGGGFDVNLCEEVGTDGKLVFVTGGPNLSMVANFLKAKAEAGELK